MGAQTLFKIIASVIGALFLVYVTVEVGIFKGSLVDGKANLLATISIDATADSSADSEIAFKKAAVADVVSEVNVVTSKPELTKEVVEITKKEIIPEIVPNNNTGDASSGATNSSLDNSGSLPAVEPPQSIPVENSQPSLQNSVSSSSENQVLQSPEQVSVPVAGVNHLLISEILFDADGSDAGKEFIELYNPSNQSFDISGWSIQHLASSGSLSKKNFGANDVIAPKGFFLIWLGNDARADMQWISGSLNNAAATIYLVDNQALISTSTAPVAVDAVNYDVTTLSGFVGGQSLERKAYLGSCISAQNSGEDLGNGCDTDTASDFELRSISNPQNTQSLLEPR